MKGTGSRPDIAGAIRRSQKVRTTMRRRRRTALIAAGISVAAASGSFLALVGMTGDDIVRAAVAQSKSLADLLDARSPGSRTEAQLTKTKHARALSKQRMAPRHAPAPPKPDMAEVAQLLAPSGAPEPVSIATSAPDLIGPPPSLSMIVGVPGAGGGVIPPGGEIPPGGGGGGVIPPGGGPPLVNVPTPQPREPVTPALPEPGTWATMLLGFAFIGWRIRRGSSASAESISTRAA